MSKLRSVNAVFLLAGLAGPVFSGVERGWEKLTVQGNTFENACTRAEQDKLRSGLFMERPPAAPEAWQLVEAVLCAPEGAETLSYLRSVLRQHTHYRSEGTGEKAEIGTARPSAEFLRSLMARGNAWDSNLTVEKNRLILDYRPNEACIRSVTLRYENSKWWISDVGGACD